MADQAASSLQEKQVSDPESESLSDNEEGSLLSDVDDIGEFFDGDDDLSDEDFALDPALRARREPSPAISEGSEISGINLDKEDEEAFLNFFGDLRDENESNNNNLKQMLDAGLPAPMPSVSVKKNRGRKARADQEPSEEVKGLLGEANQEFAMNNLAKAEEILSNVIRIDNHVVAAWRTLGEVHMAMGDKVKAVLAWISAGHLKPRDADLWRLCGQISQEIGLRNQAIYCFNRALSVNPNDLESLYDRGLMYKRMNEFIKALTDFKKIRKLLGNNPTIIRDIANVYVIIHQTRQAVGLYEEILTDAMKDDQCTSEANPTGYLEKRAELFDFSEVNILAELYGSIKDYARAIKLIKQTTRWLHGRESETWWDSFSDDSEFDDRKKQNKQYLKSSHRSAEAYSLPLDLRAKLALYRLKIGEKDEALLHAGFIARENVAECADLYYALGMALLEAGEYYVAHEFLSQLTDTAEYGTPRLVMSLGLCYKSLEDYVQAKEAYNFVAENADPEVYEDLDLDARIALAEVYEETGETQQAMRIISDAGRMRQLRAQVSRDNHTNKKQESGEDDLKHLPSFIPNTPIKPPDFEKKIRKSIRRTAVESQLSDLSPEERKEAEERLKEEKKVMEENATSSVQRHVAVMKSSYSAVQRGDPTAISTFLRSAGILVDMFNSSRGRGATVRRSATTASHRASKMDISEKIQNLTNRINQRLLVSESTEIDPGEMSWNKSDKFRGLTAEEWFRIFMDYALVLARYEDVQDSYLVLDSAFSVLVFRGNEEWERAMALVHVSCCLITSPTDYDSLAGALRNLQHLVTFSPDSSRLYLACLASGDEAIQRFTADNSQKFFLRQIKGIDSIVHNMQIKGAAKFNKRGVTLSVGNSELIDQQQTPNSASTRTSPEQTLDHIDDDKVSFELEQADPHLLTLYGHLLAISKTHVGAQLYFERALEIFPKEPLILLSIGLAHLARAMKRQVLHRQHQIFLGLSYLREYYTVRTGSNTHASKDDMVQLLITQEAEYNMGRAYQSLGLPSLALTHYETVLDISRKARQSDEYDEAHDMASEAAYNLHIIYSLSGNGARAREIVDEFLVL